MKSFAIVLLLSWDKFCLFI